MVLSAKVSEGQPDYKPEIIVHCMDYKLPYEGGFEGHSVTQLFVLSSPKYKGSLEHTSTHFPVRGSEKYPVSQTETHIWF